MYAVGAYSESRGALSNGPGLVNTLSIQLQQVSAVLAMAQNNPLAAGRAAQKVFMLAQVTVLCIFAVADDPPSHAAAGYPLQTATAEPLHDTTVRTPVVFMCDEPLVKTRVGAAGWAHRTTRRAG